MKNIYCLGKNQYKIGGRNLGHYIADGYELFQTKIGHDWKKYLFKVRRNESHEHAFLCWYIESLLSKIGLESKLNESFGADLELEHKGKKICFEIETGKRLDRMKRMGMYRRFCERAKMFDLIFVIVPTERVARRYRSFGKPVITKAQLEGFIHSYFLTHTTQGS